MDYRKVEVPRWIAVAIVILQDLPSTNAKLVFAMLMTAGTGAFLLACVWRSLHPDPNLLDSWYVFLGSWAALGTLQYGVKRFTYRPDPPNAPDVEDVPASSQSSQAPSPEK